MKNKILYIILLVAAIIIAGFIFVNLTGQQKSPATVSQNTATTTTETTLATVEYRNTQYGFGFTLPISWKGYTIITSE